MVACFLRVQGVSVKAGSSGMYDPNLDVLSPPIMILPHQSRAIFSAFGRGRMQAGRSGWRLAVGPAAGPPLPSPGSTSTHERGSSRAPHTAQPTVVLAPGLKLRVWVQFLLIYSCTQILHLLLNSQSHLFDICIFRPNRQTFSSHSCIN